MSIQDFGEKIGGAKKDLWKQRCLVVSDLDYMNDAEKDKYIRKDNIWKKPDYQRRRKTPCFSYGDIRRKGLTKD